MAIRTYKPTSAFTNKNDDDDTEDEIPPVEPIITNRRRGLGNDGIDLLKQEPEEIPSIFGDSNKVEEETFEPLVRRRRDRAPVQAAAPEQLNFKNLPTKIKKNDIEE